MPFQTTSTSKFKNVNGIFNIGLSIDDKLTKTVKRGLTAEQYKQEISRVTSEASHYLAETARKKMSDWIKKGGEKGIGYKGRSARNLTLASHSGGDTGVTTWYVIEAGNDLFGNMAIRQGVKKDPADSERAYASAGRKAMGVKKKGRAYRDKLYSSLDEWARRHHFVPQQDLFKDDYESSWKGMVWAIWHTVKKKGTSQGYQKRWGKPFFDYPGEYARSSYAKTKATYQLEQLGRNRVGNTISEITYSFVGSALYKRLGVSVKIHSRVAASDFGRVDTMSQVSASGIRR